jgi:tight adherence protein B
MAIFLVVVIAIWLCAVGAWWVFSSASRKSDVDRLKSRLLGTSRAKREKKSAQNVPSLIQQEQKSSYIATSIVQRFQLQAKLHDLLEQAGIKWSPAKLINACLVAGVAGFFAGWVLLPADYRQVAYLTALVAAVTPLVYVLRKRKGRMKRFEELFPESLEFVARSMRAGHAFSVSLEMIHREFQEPLAGEFRRTFEEHNLGLPLDVSLQKLAKRVPSLDVHFFVSAVLLQKRTGGNLAEILDKLAYVIRERFKLRGRIRAISAHGRMTGIALTCIPVGVAVIMFYVNPDYVRFFFKDEVGHYMMGAAISLQLIGYLVIQKIVTIEV